MFEGPGRVPRIASRRPWGGRDQLALALLLGVGTLLGGVSGCFKPVPGASPLDVHGETAVIVPLEFSVEHGEASHDDACGEDCFLLRDGAAIRSQAIPYRQQHFELSLEAAWTNVVRGDDAWNQFLVQVIGYDRDERQVQKQEFAQGAGTSPFRSFSQGFYFEERDHVDHLVVRALLWNARGVARVRRFLLRAVPPPEAYLKVPPLAEVEDQPPKRWPRPAILPLDPAFESGVATFGFDVDGRMHVESAGPEATRLRVVDWPGRDSIDAAGTDLARGFAQRTVYRAGDAEDPSVELNAEVFRGSGILSLFYRTKDLEAGTRSIRFETLAAFSRLTRFHGLRAVETTRPSQVCLPVGVTVKPVLAIHDDADSGGIVFYFPYATETRRWYIEDYRVRARTGPCLSFEEGSDGLSVDWTGGARTPANRTPTTRTPTNQQASTADDEAGLRTLDRAVFVYPYRGHLRDAIEELSLSERSAGEPELLADRNPLEQSPLTTFWDLDLDGRIYGVARSLRMERYQPAEFASWIPGTRPELSYGHDGGLAWGSMMLTMKGIRIDPLASSMHRRDQAFRMLAFFLAQGAKTGAPTNYVMYRRWAAKLANPDDYRDHAFCQIWEFRLLDFLRFFDSPFLTDVERARAYDDLQRARPTYSPNAQNAGTFALPTENGGLWFDYYNQRFFEENPWIINTHITALVNIAHFIQLSERMNDSVGKAAWVHLFRLGLLGLFYATDQDWMWYGADRDPNELRYSARMDGPSGYHFYAATGWLPMLLEPVRAHAPEALSRLIALTERTLRARFLEREHPKETQAARDTLARFDAPSL